MALYEPLIDRTYFNAELTIGQADQQEVEAELLIFIRKYEYEFLLALMGMPLYTAFYTAMKEPADPIEQKWKELAYGKWFNLDASKVQTGMSFITGGQAVSIPNVYYTDGMPIDYRGLLSDPNPTDEPGQLTAGYGVQSPIANYIYWHWMKDHYTLTGGAGEVKPAVQNGQRVDAMAKMVRAWNEMCDAVTSFYFFIDQHISDYPEFTGLPVDNRFQPCRINPILDFM